MRIHKEGRTIIIASFIAVAALASLSWMFLPAWAGWLVSAVVLVLFLVILCFFRLPDRERLTDSEAVFSPADGKVVVIEEVEEKEYFGDRRIQISVFMSLSNVHVNWFPVGGEVKYFKHHHGKYMVAWHPKSSESNERTTVVVDMGSGRGQILFRQIAGFLARRIVSYAIPGTDVEQNWQCGFIKLGSRVDVFLPLDAKVNVQLGEKVTGSQTVLAYFNGHETGNGKKD